MRGLTVALKCIKIKEDKDTTVIDLKNIIKEQNLHEQYKTQQTLTVYYSVPANTCNSKDFYLYASIIYGECNNKIN